MDLLMNRETHDLVFINGECPTTGDIVDVVTQRLYIRLRTFLGEWFLDVGYGVPWLERILGHKLGRSGKSKIDMIIQEQIMSEVGVAKIISFSSTYDNPTRKYSCRFRISTDSGQNSSEITI